MASRTEIANLALGALGTARITDIDQHSPGALAVRDAWSVALGVALRMNPWSFAIKRSNLTAELAPPMFGYAKAFRLPSDYVRMVEVNGELAGTRGAAYTIEGRSVLTSAEACQIRYVRMLEEVEIWDPCFVQAFGFALAEAIAPALSLSVEIASAMERKKEMAARRAILAGACEVPQLVRALAPGGGEQ